MPLISWSDVHTYETKTDCQVIYEQTVGLGLHSLLSEYMEQEECAKAHKWPADCGNGIHQGIGPTNSGF